MSHATRFFLAISMICCLCCFFGCSKNPTDNGPYTPPPGATSNGYFSVSNPGNGLSYQMGAYDSITWTSSLSSSSYVRVDLYNDQQLAYTYSTYTLNDGVVPSWYIPTGLVSGNRYHIKIQSATDTSQWDFGSYFTLYSNYYGTYSIQNPVDSTVWQAGNSYTIQWQYTGSPGTYITLQLYNDSTYYSSISTLTSLSTGSYTWTIPGTIASGTNYRIKITSYYDAGLYSFSERFSITGLDPDAYENDNMRDSAKTAVSGVTQQHTITYSDTDWVRIAMDSGNTYIIQDSGVAYFYTRLDLYYGTETSYSTYNYSTSTLTWQYACTQTGTYYLKIYPYYSGYTGSYTLRVTEFDPYTAVTFSSPTSSVPWTAGSTYTISWTPDVGMFSSYIALYLYKGNSLVYSIDTYDPNDGSYSFTVPAGYVTGSDYRIRLANYNYPSSIYAWSDSFTISGVVPDAYEYDDTLGAAKSITTDGTVQNRTLSYNNYDYISFTAEKDSVYCIQGSSLYMYIYLFNSSGTSLTYNYGYAPKVLWTCPTSGTYYLRVSQYSTSYYGSYGIYVRKYALASGAIFTNPTAGLTWNAGSAYSVTWNVDTSLFSSYIALYIYKGNTLVYSIDTYDANDGSYSFTVPAGFATGSDYHIRLANYNYSSVYATSDTFSISGIAPDTYEYDDSLGAAKPITTDGTPQGRTLSYGDYDYISFTAEKDSVYCIQGSSQYMYIYLYNSTGSSITYNYYYAPKILWTCTASGTYYVRVSQYSTSYYGSYGIYVRKYSLASSSIFTNPVAGTAWNAGSAYSVTWSVDTSLLSSYVNLYIYKGNQLAYTIYSYTSNDGSYSFTVPAGFATGGDYHIRLVNYYATSIYATSDSFSISGIAPDSYEPDNSAAAAHAIATDGTPESHTLTVGDKDWYHFSGTANLLYVVQSHGAAHPALYLYNTDGTSLLSSANTAFTDTIGSIVWMCPATGTYYLRDSTYTTSYYGSYTASVTSYDSASYSFSVTAPAAGDTLTIGVADTITWSGTVPIGGNVDIYLYNSTGIVGTIVAGTANDGTYVWTAGTILTGTASAGDTYYIRIFSLSYPAINGNSGVFSIK